MITLDTTRPDRLGCYGYSRPTSPNLDALARESVLYTQAFSTSSWTLPSHASLFTGKFTSSHGARYDEEGPLRITDGIKGPKGYKQCRVRGLALNELTLPLILQREGYATGAVVGGPWMKKVFGLNRGFDHYDDDDITRLSGRIASEVTAGAEAWIKNVGEKKFFLFLNYFDPHGPYKAPEGFDRTFLPKETDLSGRKPTVEESSALYDGEIRYMDHYIGRFLKQLKALGLYEKTWIIVTSDHGELIGEHGKFGHGSYLYQEELHIPLFLKYPEGEVPPGRVSARIQLADLLPMICKRLGVARPKGIQGNVPPQLDHPIVAETYPLEVMSEEGHWRAIFEGSFKFIWNSRGRHLLFNLAEDPKEMDNLYDKEKKRAERMGEELKRYLEELPEPGPPAPAEELDEQTKEALKKLGYLEQ